MRQIAIIIISVLVFTSCVEDNSTTYDGGKADIITQFITLKWDNWDQGSDQYTWFQEFEVPLVDESIADYGTVLAFWETGDGWESLPITHVFWTEDGTTYSTEFWYSYDYKRTFFYYTNTHPDDYRPPQEDYRIKLVILDGDFHQFGIENDVDLNDHDDIMKLIERQETNAGK